jgi:hypothetical protein
VVRQLDEADSGTFLAAVPEIADELIAALQEAGMMELPH